MNYDNYNYLLSGSYFWCFFSTNVLYSVLNFLHIYIGQDTQTN